MSELRCETSSETLILGYFKRRMLFTTETSGNNIKTVVLWVLGGFSGVVLCSN